jgi:hypothetical protein
MAKTIHMQEFDPVEGSGMFEDKGQRFYVNINIGIVTITPVRLEYELMSKEWDKLMLQK